MPQDVLATLWERFPDVAFVPADDAETLAREIPDADVFYGFGLPAPHLAAARRLRWIQCITAGVESGLAAAVRGRDVVVTNGAGIAADTIAEHALALLLACCRNLHVALRLQTEARWDRMAVMAGTGTGLRELADGRVAVLGLGPIGRAFGARAAALGATVHGMRRRPEAGTPAPFARVVGPPGLDELLGWADFVVLAVPHTPATDRLVGQAQLARMRPEAYLVNVARGAVVDEPALVAALRRGAIAGAALDVFAEEPLPPGSPLWQLPNVLLTPHVAGATPHYLARALALFVDNLERLRTGRRLRNVVDPDLGYPMEQEENQ